MGACYSVVVKLKIQEGKEQDLIDALNKKIENDTNKRSVNYWTEELYPNYNAPYNLEQLCDIFFVKHQNMYDYTRKDDNISIDSGFDASYGWKMVMFDAFELMAPFLKDGSKLVVDADEGTDTARIKAGQIVFS